MNVKKKDLMLVEKNLPLRLFVKNTQYQLVML